MNHEQPTVERPLEPISQLAQEVADGQVGPMPSEPDQHEAELAVRPQIWVASLSDHNNGIFHGAWIDAGRDEDELRADITAMLAASPWAARSGEPATQWAIHDQDGCGELRFDEHENLRWISLVAKGIAQHGLAFAAYAEVVEEEELLASFDQDYLGHYDSLHAYLEQTINDLGYDRILDEVVPPKLRPYVKIDIDATARDLQFGGDLHVLEAIEGGVWIFRG